jgi:membrane protein implicated in regulation of membrane protease activity
MTLFLICGGVGLILLLISMFSGHDSDLSHDMDHGSSEGSGPSSANVFSFRTIVVFLTAFGATGAASVSFGVDVRLASVIGLTTGVVFAFISWSMMNYALKQQASSLISTNDLIGLIGVVHTTIPAKGIGEISVELHGQRKYLPARAKDETEEFLMHAQVKIIGNASGTLIVEKSI